MPAPSYSVKEQRAWYMYDWANSAYASTVLTLFLGPYLTAVARSAADAAGYVHPFGIPIYAPSYWSYLISLSVATQVLCLPLLGAIADYSGRKKELLGVFAYIGAFATMAMYFIAGGRYLLGGALFLVSNLAFGAAMVLANAFLPDLAPEADRDAVSSKGWGIGYLGGGLLLLLNLLLYANAGRLGIEEGYAVRLSLCSAGAWWALFTLIPMAGLRRRRAARHVPPGESLLSTGFLQLAHTAREMKRYPQTLTFLAAFLIYNDGIQAVIALAGQFGADYVKIPQLHLTQAILMVQFVAFAGALGFNQIAKRITAKGAVLLALALWTLVMIAMFFVTTTLHYFAAAAVVGIIMGGSQALSRSLYSLMIPAGREAEYFSLYEVSDKGTSWLAPLIYGLTLQATGSYRYAILSLIVFFLAGIAVLMKVDVRRAAREAGHEAP